MRQSQRRLFGYFDKEVNDLRHILSRREGERVDALLLTGDKERRIYTDAELLEDGVKVDGIGHVTFTPKEVEGYKRVRQAYDDLYVLVNKMLTDELKFGGYQMYFAKIMGRGGVSRGDTRIFVKTNEIEHTRPAINKAIDLRVGSKTNGAPVDLDSILGLGIDLNNKRVGFAKLRRPMSSGGKTRYTYALVDVDDTGGLIKAKGALEPDFAIDYRKGYVPKIAQANIRWIVEKPFKAVQNGIITDDTMIVRGFETESEARIFLAREQSKGKQMKAYATEVTDRWRGEPANREKVEFLDNALFHGAFVGDRRINAKFKVGLDGAEAERVSSFDALQRYADYVASYAPMHEFKQKLIKQFIDAAKSPDGSTMLQIKGRWDSEIVGSGEQATKLMAIQKWMRDVFSVPTTEEHIFSKFNDRMLGFLEKAIYSKTKGDVRTGFGGLRGLHHWMSTSHAAREPVSYLKSWTFDMMLGAFSWTQFFVQSAGMFIPASLHPLKAAAAMPKFLFYRTAQMFDNYADMAKAAKVVGINSKEASTFLHAWHRSGIPDSILENADFGHYAGVHGAYYSKSMLNTVREKSRVFYNQGEINNRLFSFTVAFDDLAKKNKWNLLKPLSERQIQEVTKEALRLGTNMTAGNKAKWQDGIFGLPTQFWHTMRTLSTV
jgi:hypothetical protein